MISVSLLKKELKGALLPCWFCCCGWGSGDTRGHFRAQLSASSTRRITDGLSRKAPSKAARSDSAVQPSGGPQGRSSTASPCSPHPVSHRRSAPSLPSHSPFRHRPQLCPQPFPSPHSLSSQPIPTGGVPSLGPLLQPPPPPMLSSSSTSLLPGVDVSSQAAAMG